MTTISPATTVRALHQRLIKAEALVANNKVHPVFGMANHYIVEGKESQYLVNGRCICPDSANRTELRGWCKHKLAATIYAEQDTVANNPQAAKATKKTAPSPESDRPLEDQLADLYPKAPPTSSPR